MPYSPGKPVAAVVPPGQCAFGDEFSTAELVSRDVVNHNTRLLTFGLAGGKDATLGLSTCACILARGGADAEGKPVVRPYTPVSTNALAGQFQLLVKIYDQGVMSTYLDTVDIGSEVEFKHIAFNVKIQYPFPAKKLGMLVGGTGITPMIQALHAILGTGGDTTEVSMLYGSRTMDDILGKDTLDEWGQDPRLSVNHVLSHEEEGSAWDGARGFINKELIEANFAPPGPDTMIFVCGPPPMYEALCGPRGEKEVSGLLKDMGYTDDMVTKF